MTTTALPCVRHKAGRLHIGSNTLTLEDARSLANELGEAIEEAEEYARFQSLHRSIDEQRERARANGLKHIYMSNGRWYARREGLPVVFRWNSVVPARSIKDVRHGPALMVRPVSGDWMTQGEMDKFSESTGLHEVAEWRLASEPP
jgi:hypothetical protein